MSAPGLAFELVSEAATLALGAALARSLSMHPAVTVLLSGPLGAGKTTLVRGLVAALPGAENARVSSPSFTLVNRYPTTPPVAHVDLYRLDSGLPAPEEVEDALDDDGVLAVIEWAEQLPADELPSDFLRLQLQHSGMGRTAHVHAEGKAAANVLASLTEVGMGLPSRPKVT